MSTGPSSAEFSNGNGGPVGGLWIIAGVLVAWWFLGGGR